MAALRRNHFEGSRILWLFSRDEEDETSNWDTDDETFSSSYFEHEFCGCFDRLGDSFESADLLAQHGNP